MLSYTDVLHANIFLWFGNKFTDFFVLAKFLLTLQTGENIKESKILRLKIQNSIWRRTI